MSRTPFPPVSSQAWRERVTRDLKGRAWSRLQTPTDDGLVLEPVYDHGPTPAHAPAADRPRWEQRQHVASLDAAREALDRGATAVAVGRDVDPSPLFELGPVHLSGDVDQARAALSAGMARGGLGLGGPIALARRGHAATDAHWDAVAELMRAAPSGVQVLRIDTAGAHHAGAPEGLDLALSLASGLAALTAMDARGALDACAGRVEVSFRLGTHFLQGIAKLRAARVVWAQMLRAMDLDPTIVLHAQVSDRVLSTRDVWVNLLRNTTAVFAAGVGGADAITSVRFDRLLRPGQVLGLRVARNTQTVLQDEAHLGRVQDPAAGSWALETLTHQLAETAWARFQALPPAALAEHIQSGALNRELADHAATRATAVARRKRALTGVSEYPLLAERRPEPAPQITPAVADQVPALPLVRLAQPFEDLRDRSDAYLAEHGHRPRVQIVPLGTPAQHTPRVGFARNLLMAGGLEPSDDAQPVAVVCGPDALYAEGLPTLDAAVWVAGRPGDYGPTAGFIHLGCDALAALHAMWNALSTAPPATPSVRSA